jgi:dTDP-4-amino-4,6-dideoxygalactose transaminase
VKEGDEVILPAYTYSATANVVIHCGATPVLVDIGGDFNMDVTKIEAAITKNKTPALNCPGKPVSLSTACGISRYA